MYFYESHTSHDVSYEKTVHEQRAPTNDSIKIYEEMKEKAFASTIDSFQIKNTTVDLAAAISRNMDSFGYSVYWRVILNDEKLEGEFHIDDFDPTTQDIATRRNNILRKIFKKISEQLAEKLTRQIFDQMQEHRV